MQLTLVLDHKFIINSAGQVCAHTMFGESFWKSYLTTFDSINVVCRTRDAMPGESGVPILDDRIRFSSVPYYEGPYQFFKRYFPVTSTLKKSLNQEGAVILRVFQVLPTFAASLLIREQRPYGVEVVGDPWDAYAPGAETNIFRPFFRRYFHRKMKKTCRNAVASCYVTQFGLQKRYPPDPDAFTTYASDVQIDHVAEPRRLESFEGQPRRLLFVGALNRLYKGQDILLKAMARLIRSGHDLHLTIVGDGQFRPMLESLAAELSIADRVRFTGALPFGEPVFQEMDKAHLFVLPSRQEGLARTVPEAMSRGLPCIASDVGGMAEIVPARCLVVPGNIDSLVGCLETQAGDPANLSELSREATQTVRKFLRSETEPRRELFMHELRERSR